jgi:RimJ/RimL family protein N-acetyltransferase
LQIAETKRLIISKIGLNDAAFILALVNTPSYIKYIGDKNLRNLSDAKNYIKNTHFISYKTHNFGFYKVLYKNENQKPIGTCGFVKRSEFQDVEIGFGFLPEYEGKGFGFEASQALLELAKSTFKLKKITATTLPSNKRSISLLEKLDLVYEKRIKPFDDDEELLLFAKTL